MGLNTLYTSKAEFTLHRIKGRQYEQGEKAGHLLAAQLRQQEAALAIPAIQSTSRDILTRPKNIVNEFASFYKELYTPESLADLEQKETFLSRVHLPSLADEGQKLLEGDCSRNHAGHI